MTYWPGPDDNEQKELWIAVGIIALYGVIFGLISKVLEVSG